MTAVGARVKFRDIQVAEDVGKRAELGWLDVEFIMYGSAFYEKNYDEMRYIISSQAKDVYGFLKKGNLRGVYPSIVEKLTLKCPVPLGTKEWIEGEIKKELAKQLRDMYPKEIFQVLCRYDKKSNIAEKKLWEVANEIEGLFHKEQLEYFHEMINYACEHHLLSIEGSARLLDWLRQEEKNSYEINSLRGKNIKVLFGGMIQQKQNDKEQAIVDAKMENVVKKMIDSEKNGDKVSPIFEKAFELNRVATPAKIRKIFQQELQRSVSVRWWEELFVQQKHEMAILRKEFSKDLQEINDAFGEKAATTIRWYGYRWGIL